MSAARVEWSVAGVRLDDAAERASRIAARLLPLSPERGALWSEHADRVLEAGIVADELGLGMTATSLLAPDGEVWELAPVSDTD